MAFDASAIERHGWRQGAVLGPKLVIEARKHAPIAFAFARDWLIVTSHDCDIVNGKLEKEPTVDDNKPYKVHLRLVVATMNK